ncbi:hypothetical protein LX36DRAFT_104212 [Colletotrichum falcatum]|nr:hypothetical protein LX36DRAFT_104212 [Colletotrichum falcatum]
MQRGGALGKMSATHCLKAQPPLVACALSTRKLLLGPWLVGMPSGQSWCSHQQHHRTKAAGPPRICGDAIRWRELEPESRRVRGRREGGERTL